jgi:uncharacterized protein (TIGR00251 family)
MAGVVRKKGRRRAGCSDGTVCEGAVIGELKLTLTKSGILLPVRAKPNSRKNEIRGVVDGALSVAVSAIAEKGKANRAIVELLADQLGIPKSRIQLTGGESSSRKKFLIKGIDPESLVRQLRNVLPE